MFFVFKRKRVRRKVSLASHKKYLAYKEVARAIAHERVAYFSSFYDVSVNRIAIRNSSSRWGSCSKKGNLNFNYKIALLPKELTDYIIVHEVCHLLEFNHSKKFWEHVSKTTPNHKTLRKKLREISRVLR